MNWKNHCARYVAFLVYFLIFAIIFAAVALKKAVYTVDKVYVNSDVAKFNEMEDPSVIVHLTDIHLSN